MRSPSSAPAMVKKFHSTYTPTPALKNPRRFSSASTCPKLTAVDSSMVTCAIHGTCRPRGRSACLICMPYTALRMPSPPPEITPMKANCDPPVNISALKAMVCQRFSPAAMDSAPKEIP